MLRNTKWLQGPDRTMLSCHVALSGPCSHFVIQSIDIMWSPLMHHPLYNVSLQWGAYMYMTLYYVTTVIVGPILVRGRSLNIFQESLHQEI